MARVTVFADGAGNFDFSLASGASRYFILTTVRLEDCTVGDRLLDLRRRLAWDGLELSPDGFHASEDKQRVRDQVFALLATEDFRVDSTILHKRKTQPPYDQNERAFYKLAWFLHFNHIAPRIVGPDDQLLVVAASLGTKAKRTQFSSAVDNVLAQTTTASEWKAVYWPAATDPCL